MVNLRLATAKSFPAAYKSLIKGNDGWDYIDPKMFASDFSGDLPKSKADFMANSQTPTADVVFHAIIQNPPENKTCLVIWWQNPIGLLTRI